MNCPICGAQTRVEHGALYDDRYGFPGRFDLHRCGQCGHRVLDARFTAAELGRLYTGHYPRARLDLATWRPKQEPRGMRAWLSGARSQAWAWVPRRVRVLDVGCGFCEALAYHASRGCEVHGVEADENVRRVAGPRGFEVRVGVFDPGAWTPESFDFVTLDQVIEHVVDPIETLRGIARLLAPRGTAVLSTPNADGLGARLFGRRWIHWHAPYHLQFFSRRSMELAAAAAGLRVARTKVLTSSEWLYYQWIHLASYPREGTRSTFWDGGISRARLAFAFHLAKGNHVLTRLLDALGAGDNQLFFLVR